jgi:DNA-binding CsgD family transcriptional regulator
MEGFAERARRELLATGETACNRRIETVDELAAQEAQIAGLARDGRSNPEFSIRLFISPRTAEWHLHEEFTKLGINSRNELRAALPDLDLILAAA